MKRVVVTGLGAATPLGVGVEPLTEGLFEGRSGTSEISLFDASPLRSRIAGEVTHFDPASFLTRKLVKRTSRFSQLALWAAREAIGQSGLETAPEREDYGVVIGSGIGGFEVLEAEHEKFLQRGPGRFAPLTVPTIIPNMAAGLVATETGWAGPNLATTTACATGSQAIGTAMDWIRLGRAEVVVAGAAESAISPFSIDGYCQLRALSTRNDEPETASRPFSADRDGFVLAEGAAVLVLEELEHAKARRANILAELAGYGTTSDAYHPTAPAPDGRGAARAMRRALDDARVAPSDVGVVNAHGTGTQLNDATETVAVRKVFGSNADKLKVQATKSMLGHSLGAAGAIEAVVSVLGLVHQTIHPTINLIVPDPACDLDYVQSGTIKREIEIIVSNSFGFGGHNSVLVFRRFN